MDAKIKSRRCPQDGPISHRGAVGSIFCLAAGLLLSSWAFLTEDAFAADARAAGATARTVDFELSTVRRTTIVTADIEASIRFYVELLGFTVDYDVETTDPVQIAALARGAARARVIVLRQGEKLGGSIGLFTTPGLKAGKACELSAAGGAVGIMLLTNDLDTLARRLKAATVPFVTEPYTYDNSRGKGPIGAFTVFDPNCVRITFAKIKGETLEKSEQR